MNTRQVRLLALSVLAILLIVVLFNSSSSLNSLSENDFANDILNSHNNDKTDEAINNQILKSQTGVEEDTPAPEKQIVEAEEVADDVPFDAVKELLEIRSISPMVVFSKTFCPYSKRLKKLLSDHYEITPEYTVVELDKHKHGKLLQEHLGKISGRNTVPNVLVGTSNESKGGCDDFLILHESGKLAGLLNEWGEKKISVKKLGTPSNL